MRRAIIALVGVATLFSSVINTDNMSTMDDAPDQFEIEMMEVIEEIAKQYIPQIEEKKGDLNGSFDCTGGVDPKTLSKKDYLAKFAAGPCAPFVALPGISGSKLIARIDCKTLKSSNPSLFSSCGWNACKTGFLLRPPKVEYQVWMPAPLAPMSLTTLYERNKRCFGGFMTLHYKLSEGTIQPFEQDGITITTLGESLDTQKAEVSECGFMAIKDTLPVKTPVEKRYRYFGVLGDYLINAGYVYGLTLQAMPYDWRMPYQLHNLATKFQQIIEDMSLMVGKKVVVVGHSMGNFQALHNLWSLPQAWKDQNVARYIAIAPPYLGSPMTTEHPLGMDKAFFGRYGNLEVGLEPEVFKETVAIYPSTWQLMPKPTFRVFKDAGWMQDLMARIKAEQTGGPVPTGTVMDIFPSYSQSCSPGFTERDAGCTVGAHEMYDIGSVAGDSMNPDNVSDIFGKYSYLQQAKDLYAYANDDRFNTLINPGIQVNIIYGNHLQTLSKVKYDSDPRIKTLNNEFYPPDQTETELGDGIVLTASAIVPGIKWAEDFRSGAANAKPVNIIEICSAYKRRPSIFEDQTKKTVTNNAYFGTNCDCEGTAGAKKQGLNCNHGGMMVDDQIVSFIGLSAIDGQVGKVGGKFATMTEQQLEDYVNNCKLFNP